MRARSKFVWMLIVIILLLFVMSCGSSPEYYAQSQQAEKEEPARIRVKKVKEEEHMPQIVDIIIENDKCTALCEDGSVWEWKRYL